jgi:hypothetical protein
MKMMDNFTSIMNETLDEEYKSKFPASARLCLEHMNRMILDSQSPADVALAISLGLAFVLYASSNPEKTLSIVLAASSQIADKIMSCDHEQLKDTPGEKFFKELKEKIQ